MSIRFRLTLLYSTILALTLIVFGIGLYSIQDRDTLNSLKHDMALSSGKFTEAALQLDAPPPTQDPLQPTPPRPKPFNEFTSDQAFQDVREREVVRILDSEGNLLASPFGRQEDALPLSEAGLSALQDQGDWWEEAIVNDQATLIYSRPVVQDGETVYIVQLARSLTERNSSLQSLATTLGLAGGITILLAFGAGWTLSGFSLRPIQRLTHTAQAIGEERDFTRRVAHSGPADEVGQLADTFNQMLTELHDAYQKLERSLEMQRDFVADVSHELRTPLTTLRGNLALLRRNPPTPPDEQADILTDMVEETDRLIHLVNELLLLARTDAGRCLELKPLALQPVLEETARQAQRLDETRRIALADPGRLSILADRNAFKQILLILLDNALKHSASDVHVKAKQIDGQVQIAVLDSGPGIPPEDLEHIFDRFFRGERGRYAPGFGLGLPIARALTEGMHGAITIDSQPGEGTRVTLHFPSAGEAYMQRLSLPTES